MMRKTSINWYINKLVCHAGNRIVMRKTSINWYINTSLLMFFSSQYDSQHDKYVLYCLAVPDLQEAIILSCVREDSSVLPSFFWIRGKQ